MEIYITVINDEGKKIKKRMSATVFKKILKIFKNHGSFIIDEVTNDEK